MEDFNPFEAEFDPNVDPITADQHGLAILNKLEEGEKLRGSGVWGVDNAIDTHIPKLKDNLSRYQQYKVSRGEKLFSYEPEVIARQEAKDEEQLARAAVKLIQADEETFKSILEENGDAEDFAVGQAFMQDKEVLKKDYKLRRLLKMSGYSDRMIDMGVAEPHMRQILGADEESSEPTLNAFSRWGLTKVNEFDRRRKLSESAAEQAFKQFSGMTGDVDTFETAVEEANPDITDQERTELRRLYNINTKKYEESFGGSRELVQKAFNTIAGDDGLESKFKDAGAFEDLDEAAIALSKVPRKDFPAVVAMLANTAEAHGQDMDSFAAKLGSRLSRSTTGMLDRAGMGGLIKNTQRAEKEIKGRIDSGSEIWVPKEVKKGSRSVATHFMVYGAKTSQAGGFDRAAAKFFDTILPGEQNSGEYRKVEGEELEGMTKALRDIRHREYVANDLRNWRETVSKIRGRTGNAVGDAFMDDWVYGVAGSLPEMGATMMSAAGMSLVANAKYAENMAEIRRRNPEMTDAQLAKQSTAANVGAVGYALAGRAQLRIGGNLMRRLPKTGKVLASLAGVGAVGSTVFKEAVVETVQDLTLATSMELFGALDEDIQDFELGSETMEAVKRFPRTMFAVAPLALAGAGGRKALNYIDQKSFEKLFRDSELMEAYGIDAENQAIIKQLDVDGALDYIQENNTDFLQNMVELEVPDLEFNAQIMVREDNTFSVTNGQSTVLARSPEEAAEAVQQLDPGYTDRFSASQSVSYTPVEIDGITVQRPTADLNIDPFFNEEMVFHTFAAPGFNSAFDAGESKSRRREGLPPLPDAKSGKYTWIARKRFGFQQWLSQRDVPSKTLQKTIVEGTRLADGVEAQFNEVARSLDAQINKHVKRQPKVARDTVYQDIQADTYMAIRGDKKAMKRLPKKIRKVARKGRKSIDLYSKDLIDTGAVSGDLAKTVGDNMGAYVTREFKVYDEKSGWNYTSVKAQHPQVYQNALSHISKKEGISTKEADAVIQEMLDPSKARGFISGNSNIDKINIRNFIQRKDLDKPILELLGEVKNPAVNIRNTGKNVSRIAITNATQAHMAEQLINAGLASRKKNSDLRHTERLGGESYDFVIEAKDGNPSKVGHGVRTGKAFAGFGELYLDPELATHLKAYFEGGPNKKSGFTQASDLLATATGAGKFMQVILNPAAYPTNFLGGVATEIFNGRMSLDAKGARAYLKRGSVRDRSKSDPYGVKEQRDFYDTTGAQFLKSGGVNTLTWQQLNTEMGQRGLRDNSVIAEDLNQTIDRGFGKSVGKGVRVLSKAYQAPDNAAKRSAFVHELNVQAKADPDAKMDELIRRAAENVRMTTQNYDMVPDLLRQFSQRGVLIPTYISFTFELFRNTINTTRLARQEIFSGNKVLRNNGFKRVAGMAVVGALLYGMNELLSSFLSGLEGEEEENIRALLPPWLEDSEVVMMNADGKSLAYFDGSYLIPHQIFYNAASRAYKQDSLTDSAKAFGKALLAPVGGLNIFHQTAAEAITNQKRGGGPIYNEELAVDDTGYKTRAIVGHFIESMYTPGVVRTYRKWEKAKDEQIGYAGSTATMDDIWLGVFGVRPYRLDLTSDEFLVDNLREFGSRSSEAKGFTSKRKQERRTEDEQAEADAKVKVAQERLTQKLRDKVAAFKALNISDERIKAALKEARVPKKMRSALKEAEE